MNLRFLFLEPQGRLAPKPFARGLVLLTGAFMVVIVLSAIISPQMATLQYAFVFPYICLFGKRLHDAGLSAWLWLALAAGSGFTNMLVSAFLLPVLSPQAYAVQAELAKLMETEGFAAAFEALSARGPEIARLSAVTSLAGFLVASGLTGWIVYRLRSDPQPNRHGPPTIGGLANTFS